MNPQGHTWRIGYMTLETVTALPITLYWGLRRRWKCLAFDFDWILFSEGLRWIRNYYIGSLCQFNSKSLTIFVNFVPCHLLFLVRFFFFSLLFPFLPPTPRHTPVCLARSYLQHHTYTLYIPFSQSRVVTNFWREKISTPCPFNFVWCILFFSFQSLSFISIPLLFESLAEK